MEVVSCVLSMSLCHVCCQCPCVMEVLMRLQTTRFPNFARSIMRILKRHSGWTVTPRSRAVSMSCLQVTCRLFLIQELVRLGFENNTTCSESSLLFVSRYSHHHVEVTFVSFLLHLQIIYVGLITDIIRCKILDVADEDGLQHWRETRSLRWFLWTVAFRSSSRHTFYKFEFVF